MPVSLLALQSNSLCLFAGYNVHNVLMSDSRLPRFSDELWCFAQCVSTPKRSTYKSAAMAGLLVRGYWHSQHGLGPV